MPTAFSGGIGNGGALGTAWLDATCNNKPDNLCNRGDKSNQICCINRQ